MVDLNSRAPGKRNVSMYRALGESKGQGASRVTPGLQFGTSNKLQYFAINLHLWALLYLTSVSWWVTFASNQITTLPLFPSPLLTLIATQVVCERNQGPQSRHQEGGDQWNLQGPRNCSRKQKLFKPPEECFLSLGHKQPSEVPAGAQAEAVWGNAQKGPAVLSLAEDFQHHHPAGYKSPARSQSTRLWCLLSFWRRKEKSGCPSASHTPYQTVWPGRCSWEQVCYQEHCHRESKGVSIPQIWKSASKPRSHWGSNSQVRLWGWVELLKVLVLKM